MYGNHSVPGDLSQLSGVDCISYILKRNGICCCFVCLELIEELEGARNVKFGTQVNNNEY